MLAPWCCAAPDPDWRPAACRCTAGWSSSGRTWRGWRGPPCSPTSSRWARPGCPAPGSWGSSPSSVGCHRLVSPSAIHFTVINFTTWETNASPHDFSFSSYSADSPIVFFLESFLQFFVSLDLVQTSSLLHTIPPLTLAPAAGLWGSSCPGYPATNPYFIKTAKLLAQFVYFPLRISFRIKNHPVRSDILPHSLEKSLEPVLLWIGQVQGPVRCIQSQYCMS